MNVLISGAGIAGPVLAYWLRRHGFDPVVVERSPRLRHGTGGHAVDLFGSAVQVVERMGLLPAVRGARTRNDVVVLERPGHRPVEIPLATLAAGFADGGHVEIVRGELARILHEATRDDVEYVFGDAVRTLEEDRAGLQVGFEHGLPRRFDLVIGANGLHSRVRRLVFGPEERFAHHLGGHLAVFTVPDHRGLDGRTLTFSAPNRVVVLYPVRGTGQARAVVLFRHDGPAPHHRDVSGQRALLRDVFAGVGCEVPRLLGELDAAGDFYSDAIAQIRMDSWTRGRVTLVGDAGYSPAPAVGGGTTVAAVGAYVLAAADGDHHRGFVAYEDAMRDYVVASRRVGPAVLRTAVPRSRLAVARNAWLTRLLPRPPLPVRHRLLAVEDRPRAGLAGIDLDAPHAAERKAQRWMTAGPTSASSRSAGSRACDVSRLARCPASLACRGARKPTPAHALADRKELTVPHVLVHQRISEFRRWKEVFDRLGPARAAASCRSTTVFRNREDPHEVVVLFDFDDLARARQHMGSAELRQAWQDAGVTDPGTRSVLDAVEERR